MGIEANLEKSKSTPERYGKYRVAPPSEILSPACFVELLDGTRLNAEGCVVHASTLLRAHALRLLLLLLLIAVLKLPISSGELAVKPVAGRLSVPP